MDTEEQVADEKPKAAWERPTFRRLETKQAELGLGVGADIIFIGTAS